MTVEEFSQLQCNSVLYGGVHLFFFVTKSVWIVQIMAELWQHHYMFSPKPSVAWWWYTDVAELSGICGVTWDRTARVIQCTNNATPKEVTDPTLLHLYTSAMGLGWMGLSSYIFLNGWNGYNVAIPNLKGIYILQPCLKLLPCFMCGTLQCICLQLRNEI